MTDSQFLACAEQVLRSIEEAADRSDDDIEPSRAGNVLTLDFENRTQIIVNLQQPLHEIWLAARSGGFHFRLHEGTWRDTRSERPLEEVLSTCAREQADAALVL